MAPPLPSGRAGGAGSAAGSDWRAARRDGDRTGLSRHANVPAPGPGCVVSCERVKVLVTGGHGFVGSHLVERLLASGSEVAEARDLNGDGDQLDQVLGFWRP